MSAHCKEVQAFIPDPPSPMAFESFAWNYSIPDKCISRGSRQRGFVCRSGVSCSSKTFFNGENMEPILIMSDVMMDELDGFRLCSTGHGPWPDRRLCQGGIGGSSASFREVGLIRRQSSQDQPWTIGLALGFQISNNWVFGTKFRYASGTPYTPRDQSILKTYNRARVNADHSLDLYGSRRWTIKGFTLTAFVNVMNVYSRKPSTPPICSEESQREDPPSLGIVPTIGVIAEF